MLDWLWYSGDAPIP